MEAAFDGGTMTSDAGALLPGRVDRRLGLMKRFAACFFDGRSSGAVEHTLERLVGQQVLGIALGYEDVNDHDELRHGPALAATLAGKSTLNRLEHDAKTSTPTLRANQLRLWFVSMAYVLLDGAASHRPQGDEASPMSLRLVPAQTPQGRRPGPNLRRPCQYRHGTSHPDWGLAYAALVAKR